MTNWTERLASVERLSFDILDEFFSEVSEVGNVRNFVRYDIPARQAFLYLAEHPVVGKVIVKILDLPLHRPNPEELPEEVHAHQLLAGCPHSAVAIDFLNILGLPAIVTIFYEGQDGVEFGIFSEEDVRTVGNRILKALVHLHGRGLVHRDVKPDNIFLYYVDDVMSEEPKTKISAVLGDFDALVEEDDENPRIGGTLYYAAPEVFDGRKATSASDMWSFGVTIYTLLHGNFPFVFYQDPEDWKSSVQCNERMPYRSDISDCAKDVIEQLIRHEPDERLTAEQALEHPFFNMPEGKTI